MRTSYTDDELNWFPGSKLFVIAEAKNALPYTYTLSSTGEVRYEEKREKLGAECQLIHISYPCST